MTDISDLQLDIDITVASPEDYVDSQPAPLPIGSYVFRLLDWELDNRGKTPAIVLKQVEVTEGPHQGRKVGFQRIYPTTFMRKGTDGVERKVSQLGDFIRSLGRSLSFSSIHDVKNILNAAIDNKVTFKAKVDWEAFDSEYFNEQAALKGISKGDYKSPESKELQKASSIKGKQFEGKPVATGPSGRNLEAKMRISNYYPAKE